MAERRSVEADADRLPWLEPYREPPRSKPGTSRPAGEASPVARRSRFAWIAGIAAVAAVALGAGYWLGRNTPEPPAPASAPQSTIAINDQPAQPAVNEAAPAESPPAAETPRPPAKASPVKARTKRTARRHARTSRSEVARKQYEAVRRKQEEAARTWPKMPSPGPAGQVIQLGAFSTKARAEAAYKARSDRYPLLATMPKVVVPVITQPRGEVLYVLRLGTQSREQSEMICRNLKASGDHCLVIG